MDSSTRDSFSRLLKTIRAIEENPENLEVLRDCNKDILDQILRSESVISEHREEHAELRILLRTGRPPRAEARKLKLKIQSVLDEIDTAKFQIFVWKSFGDALAHIYLDRFALKQTFYDLDSFAVKQDAGQLNGKEGLDEELKLLNAAIDAGIPAMLCDLTNVLRYGDVCLLHASDPHPIEVKSAEKLNKRGQRQVDRLERLSDFLKTDRVDGLRGSDGTAFRYEVKSPERTNLDALNACIQKAAVEGKAICNPEPGVRIVALYDDPDGDSPEFDDTFQNFNPSTVHMLNMDKNDLAWAPYAPIILSIRDENHLWDFLEGSLFLIVLIDLDPLIESWKSSDWDIIESQDQDYAIDCMHIPSRMVSKVARQFIARAAYEFLSLEWIAEVNRPSDGLVAKVRDMAEADRAERHDHEEMLERMLGRDHPWVASK